MLLKDTLRKIVRLQREELEAKEVGVEREILPEIDFRVPHALIFSGVRRCGKSTLLKQLMKKIKKGYYFNFEDQRALPFEVSDFEKLNEVFKEEYGKNDYYFFDEIQNVSSWERFVRGLLDAGKKCIITGSNASLLSRELGTRLTGRHLTYELFPFSYREMLKLISQSPSSASSEGYMKEGGFPEYLKYRKVEILQELFNDILFRDIIVRHKLRESKTIRELAVYLITNVGKEFSYNNLTKYLNLGSVNTTIAYLSYFEDSYLLFIVPKFDYSYKKQLINPKKVYCIDIGLAGAVSASFSSDDGRILENLVFLHLRRKYKDVYYFREEGECDFVVREKGKVVGVIQACYELTEENKEREIAGLQEAMKKFHLKEGVIVTFSQEDKLGSIRVIPLWKWLITSSILR